jgi:C4-dicarboxylate-specific signal transduction histidine kinase
MPMLREGVPIGILVLARSELRPFTDKQIELVTTFADQAAIAIENVRLFESEQDRTRELTKSLEDLRTTQDRLVQTQKLASLGQLTAGIAHEIKNPLNFVNNFSGVSTELIDELRDALSRMTGDDKTRAEITELADTLRDNLNKIVQHGAQTPSSRTCCCTLAKVLESIAMSISMLSSMKPSTLPITVPAPRNRASRSTWNGPLIRQQVSGRDADATAECHGGARFVLRIY